MKLWPSVTFPDVYCYLIETPGDFTGEKLKPYSFVISGWVNCHYRCSMRNSGYDSHYATPLFFPPSSLRILPSPFLTRVWGITMEKLWN